MSYSQFASKILNHAISIAKQRRAENLDAVHILAAFSLVNPRHFADQFPNAANEIELKLKKSEAGSKFNGVISDAIDTMLKLMETPERGWAMARQILKELEIDTDQRTQEVFHSVPVQEENSKSEAPSSEQIFNDQLLHEIANVTRMTKDEISTFIMQDALLFARKVLNHSGAAEHSKSHVEGLLGMTLTGDTDVEDLSPLIKKVVSENSQVSNQLAVKIAETYIEVGHRASLLDGIITPDETQELDALKLVLRDSLGSAAVSKSTARLRFEDHFSDFIGLENVKEELSKYFELGQLERIRKLRGLQVNESTTHMAFLGSPGAGKTEVARRFGLAMKDAGLLTSGHLIEVDRADLVAKYMGQTEAKTLKVLEGALGGVLFIDEAYSLVDGHDEHKGFGEEVIDVMVRFMENHRNDFTLILAGYKEPMEALMAHNEGLRSRISNIVLFPEYSDLELLEIFKLYVRKNKLRADSNVEAAVSDLIEAAKGNHGFGGARGVRNIFESTCRNQAERVAKFGKLYTLAELETLEREDVPPILNASKPSSHIGYL